MGYNVYMRSSMFDVPETESVLQVLLDLNKQEHLKHKGDYYMNGTTTSWLPFMEPDWDKNCTTVQDVFEAARFETKIVEKPWGKAVSLIDWEGKAGAEHLFCRVVAPFMDKGSYIEWIGEDFAEEVWVVQDGELKCLVREEQRWWQ